MSKKLAAVISAVALAGAAPAVTPAVARSATQPTAVAAKSCSRGFTQGTINGQSKCLRRGEYCAHAADSQYRRYGYRCVKRDAYGSYHLT